MVIINLCEQQLNAVAWPQYLSGKGKVCPITASAASTVKFGVTDPERTPHCTQEAKRTLVNCLDKLPPFIGTDICDRRRIKYEVRTREMQCLAMNSSVAGPVPGPYP